MCLFFIYVAYERAPVQTRMRETFLSKLGTLFLYRVPGSLQDLRELALALAPPRHKEREVSG